MIIPNFVDCKDRVNVRDEIELEELKMKGKSRLGIERDKIVVLYLGRIVKEKGVFDIINASNIIKEKYYNVYKQLIVIIAGIGPEAKNLEQKISNGT